VRCQRQRRWTAAAAVSFTFCFSTLSAQTWNSPEALALVHRAVDRRIEAEADASLESYRTRAHGFVFFLAQVGAGLSEPPRLVKADELAVEVYWQAPDRSKQVILGWRDGAFLPTDIEYHRDHLGIVTNNFGDMIRIGEGDEVRDVAHPLSPRGPSLYDYALGDSLSIRTAGGEVLVREVQVRPRSFEEPLVVGTLFIDGASAELVRFRFGFTPRAYLDRQLEDISIVLENARFEGRYWLPYRQEVEIRRRTTWLDFPARGIIRGRWEIEAYDMNVQIPPETFAGPAIAGLRAPRPVGDSIWEGTLDEAIAGVAAPINRQDMDALRVEVERIAGSHALGGLPARRLAAGALSDLARVNRVQGLTLGFGAVAGLERSRVEIRPYLAYGTSDDRVTGSLAADLHAGATRFRVSAARRISDFGDLPVVAPVLNSILAQEGGKDYGDYVLLQSVGAGVRHRLSGRTALELELLVEESQSVAVSASPATGSYRPNPPLGSGSYRLGRVALERASGGLAVPRDLQGRLALEAGEVLEAILALGGAGIFLMPAGQIAVVFGANLAAWIFLHVASTANPLRANGGQAARRILRLRRIAPGTGAVIDANRRVRLDPSIHGFRGRKSDLAKWHAHFRMQRPFHVNAAAVGQHLAALRFDDFFRGDHSRKLRVEG